MTDTALLCPGQGNQRPGMGSAFYEEWEAFKTAFDTLQTSAPDSTAYDDLGSLCFDTDAATLQQTEYTQPAIYTVSVAAANALRDSTGVQFEAVAGHSLGHLTACTAAGMLSPRQGLSVVTRRASAMAEASSDTAGSMAAVFFADPTTVAEVCRSLDAVAVAAHNTDRQTVISGREAAVATAIERIETRADRVRITELDVGTAFHSPLMASARDAVADALDEASMRSAMRPVISDVTGEAYLSPRIAEADLTEQVQARVNWKLVIETLRSRGIDQYIELPPAGTLSGFVERLHPEATVVTLETPADLQMIIDQ